MHEIGKTLIVAGLFISLSGLLLVIMDKLPGGWRIPGDIVIKKENFVFAFPLGTCIVISIILTILFSIFRR
jgi:hypothetical protein